MGGMLTINALIRMPEVFDFAMLSGPLRIPTNPPNQLVIWSAELMNYLFPTTQLVDVLERLNTLDEMHNSRINDKLMCHEKMRVGTGVSLQNGFLNIQEKLDNVIIPFIVFHGDKDTVCNIDGSKL